MHYKIYVPDVGGYGDHLRSVGLAELLDDGCNPSWAAMSENTPDGHDGMVAIWRPDSPLPPVEARDAMTWHAAKPDPDRGLEAGRFYVGIHDGYPPTPADLLRVKNLGGVDVQLADGNQWTIPVVAEVPRILTLDDQGRPVTRIKTEYDWFFDQADGYCRQFAHFLAETQFNGDDRSMKRSLDLGKDGWRFIWTALNYNYRINGEVGWLLELLDNDSFFPLVSATFDGAAFAEYLAQKKTELDSQAREPCAIVDGETA